LSVGLIAALPAEIRCLVRTRPVLNVPFAINPELTGIVCGIGRDAAAAAARTLLGLKIEALISWGTAGALSPEIQSGNLLLPERIFSVDGRSFITDKAWLERIIRSLQPVSLTIHRGSMTEAREILTSAAQKQELHLQTGALAADMESAAIMENARSGNVPGIVIRTVVDEAHLAIPEALVRHLDRYGRPQTVRLIPELFRSPRLIGELRRLGSAMLKAMATLQILTDRTNPSMWYKS
jgi:adenosylhomocysteine nucleosidase